MYYPLNFFSSLFLISTQKVYLWQRKRIEENSIRSVRLKIFYSCFYHIFFFFLLSHKIQRKLYKFANRHSLHFMYLYLLFFLSFFFFIKLIIVLLEGMKLLYGRKKMFIIFFSGIDRSLRNFFLYKRMTNTEKEWKNAFIYLILIFLCFIFFFHY